MRSAEGSCVLHHVSREAAQLICVAQAKAEVAVNRAGASVVRWRSPAWARLLLRTALTEQELSRA